MDDTFRVGCVERSAYLPDEFNRPWQGHGTFLSNDFLKRLAAQVLHDEKHDPVSGLTEVGNTQCMRMGDSRCSARFSGKTCHDLFVGRQRGTQHLNSDCLVHQHMSATVYGSHATLTETLINAILVRQNLSE